MSTNELDIKITNKNPKTYEDCTLYDVKLIENVDNWHQIVVSKWKYCFFVST